MINSLLKVGDMANLILLNGKENRTLNEIEVHPEEEIERIIFENDLLPDVVLLKRQFRTYTQKDIIDIVGLDTEDNILVVEMKDEMVNENVIAQVLRYAIWIETYPDAIKNLYLSNKEDIDSEIVSKFNWDNTNIKIVIIGPSFSSSVQKLINRITYPVQLIEFKKFNDGHNDIIFINEIVVEDFKAFKSVPTDILYNKEYYLKNYDPAVVEKFWNFCDRIEKFVKLKGWNLKRKNNKSYVTFKYGFPNVFSISIWANKKIGIALKIPKRSAHKKEVAGLEFVRYEDQWKQASYEIKDEEIDPEKLSDLLQAAYKNISK
jgi:hypothetical protein